MTENKEISQIIIERLRHRNISFLANECIADHISHEEREQLLDEVIGKVEDLLRSLIIDVDNDHNVRNTARRIARMYLTETLKGRYYKAPSWVEFPNVKRLDEIYTLGPITVRSTCSHHFLPIQGTLWIGIVPAEHVIGISKFNRITDWIMSRPHIQEEAVIMLADYLEKKIEPKGLAVVLRAKHFCMSWRGVKDDNTMMTNSVMRGDFLDDRGLEKRFFDIIHSQDFR
uniref:GTP cyclohydrolase I n=1 Tax=Candidatus Kentrum sp. LFY TaxID=2126342 RepID=A0A450VBQ3_9GAMM|nr:MAG: GTP cyclohydrolase I [Candidatus Kentron sp. LFY]VFK02197.1 MAG: GTP cyclohydrolase I [Candidatus Kentron sp. LFY]